MRNHFYKIILVLAVCVTLGLFVSIRASAQTSYNITNDCPVSYYVSPTGNDSNSCLFPGSPCKTIQHAIDITNGTEACPVTIHVAAGTYYEHLVMDSWESLEGGWNSDFSQRWDFENNGLEPTPIYATIIDGMDDGTCLTFNNIEGVTVDGLTIQNGHQHYAHGYDSSGFGGGAYCQNSSVHFKHTIFLENCVSFGYGSGLYNLNSLVIISKCIFKRNRTGEEYGEYGGVIYHIGGTLIISNSDFIENRGWYSTGGIRNYSDWSEFVGCRFIDNGGVNDRAALNNIYTSALIINCIFEENESLNSWGGAIINVNSNPQIINCIFAYNDSASSGGAITNWESSPEIINCTFVDNFGGELWNYGAINNRENSSPTIINSILWHYSYILISDNAPLIVNDDSSTATVTFCNIDQDGYKGHNGNIRQDPMFYDTGWIYYKHQLYVWVGGDYHLRQDSPSIDTGDNASLPPDITDLDNDGNTTEPIPLDLDGKLRIIDGVVNMGAYEYQPPIWYVDGQIAVYGNGRSWAEAFKTIQEAIDAANAGEKILVKRGTYFVNSTINIDESVVIYAGFDGTETQFSERDWRTNVTIVDGQNTVRCFYVNADATIDGLTISHGKTSWGGGAMFISSSAPVVTNSTFLENTAGTNGGGAINIWNASPIITNSLFLENDGGTNGGGAIFNLDCPAVIVTNCTFSKNDGGSGGGGAIYNESSTATVTNCILWDDSADSGNEVYNDAGTMTIKHCDLSGGMAGVVNINGGSVNDGGNNMDDDPLFVDAHRLRPMSSCIDAGDNNAPERPVIDMDGNPRIRDGTVDMGAYESPGSFVEQTVWYTIIP